MTGSYSSPSSSSWAYSKSSRFLRKSSQASCGRRSVSPARPASLRSRSRTLLIVELSCSLLLRGSFALLGAFPPLGEAPFSRALPSVAFGSSPNSVFCESLFCSLIYLLFSFLLENLEEWVLKRCRVTVGVLLRLYVPPGRRQMVSPVQ